MVQQKKKVQQKKRFKTNGFKKNGSKKLAQKKRSNKNGSWVPLGTRFMYPEAAWASWERLGSYFAVWERVLGASQVIWGAS